jgi:hypothetical protein
MSELDREIQRLEETDNAWEDTDEVVEVEFKRPLDIVVPVRLSRDTWEELRYEAKEIGVGPSTLARMWLLERLKEKAKHRKAG